MSNTINLWIEWKEHATCTCYVTCLIRTSLILRQKAISERELLQFQYSTNANVNANNRR